MSAPKVHALEASLKAWLVREVAAICSGRAPVVLAHVSASTLQRYRQQLRQRLDAPRNADEVARKLIH